MIPAGVNITDLIVVEGLHEVFVLNEERSIIGVGGIGYLSFESSCPGCAVI